MSCGVGKATEGFPVLIKNEVEKFLWGRILKLKGDLMVLECFGTILLYIIQSKFRSNRITGLEIVRGYQNFTQTHTHTHTQRERERERDTQTHTHTHTGCPFYVSILRNKTKKCLCNALFLRNYFLSVCVSVWAGITGEWLNRFP